jgi:hypothetical protein
MREVEAEAVAYVVGRHFGLDTSYSAFYRPVWTDEDLENIEDHLNALARFLRPSLV